MSTNSQATLPTPPAFDNPPLNEVVHGVRFAASLNIDLLVLGRLAAAMSSVYPRAEVKIALGTNVKTLTMESMLMDIPGRLWLYDDGPWLAQVQHDRILLNWRADRGSNYPGYKRMRSEFLERREAIRQSLAGLQVKADWSIAEGELTYIDHIPLSAHDQSWQDAGNSLLPLRWPVDGRRVTRTPVAGVWAEEYELVGVDGRLRVQAAHATLARDDAEVVETNLAEVIQTNITAVGSIGVDEDAWFDAAHRCIVWAFTEIIDEGIQRDDWGRRDA